MDIFVVTKIPVSLLCIQIVFEGPMRRANPPYPDPATIDIPRVTALDPPNISPISHHFHTKQGSEPRRWLSHPMYFHEEAIHYDWP